MTSVQNIRNVAIIAHVDHGKTTLVDQMLKQSGMFRVGELEKLAGGQHDLIMDSNPLERERGITILSKNCAVNYTGLDEQVYRINIIDTPGHADFGGEVERVLRLADGCFLLVDAAEGPMPQTKFVLTKALEAGLKPIVIVNKCDRPDARIDEVVHEVFDLFVELGHDEIALNFTTVYASGRGGWASLDPKKPGNDIRVLFETIINKVPAPTDEIDAPLQALITSLDYSDYVGRIGIGRVFAGTLKSSQQVAMIKHDGTRSLVKVGELLQFQGLSRGRTEEVSAGDLFAVVGIEDIEIGNTLADRENPKALPPVSVDEPTITMLFRINDSPFGGQEGDYVTSRQIKQRLEKELEKNVALKVAPGRGSDEFIVSGRGLLHLGVLIETMRREGFELAIGKPEVIIKQIDGKPHEPIETLVIDVPNSGVGSVMELVGSRKGIVKKMEPRGATVTHMTFEISSRNLIGLRGRVMTATAGEAIMNHAFLRFAPMTEAPDHRANGVLISLEGGTVTGYSIEAMSDRGVLFVIPQEKVYMGQIVGEHNRDNDLTINITRAKQLTNFRVSAKEATVVLKAPRQMSLEECLEYIEEDELVEITPKSVRMRKKILEESLRKRAERQARDKAEAATELATGTGRDAD